MYINKIIDLFDYLSLYFFIARLYGLEVKVPGYRSRGPGSIPGDIRFSEK
jgi:hypothetical protein